MPAECHYGSCPYHNKGEPLCYEGHCQASQNDLERYALERKLELQGYDLDELEMDNPYNGWMYE